LNPFFSFENSRFGIQKSKESTARITLYKDLRTVPNIFTMESTFAGVDQGIHKGHHLTTEDLETVGRDLCRTVLVYREIYIPPELQSLPLQQKTPSPISQKKFSDF